MKKHISGASPPQLHHKLHLKSSTLENFYKNSNLPPEKRIFFHFQVYNIYETLFHGDWMEKQTTTKFKRWEDLDITDDFIFTRVMRNKKLCRTLLEMILKDNFHPGFLGAGSP